jgi:copper chaperone CopZ
MDTVENPEVAGEVVPETTPAETEVSSAPEVEEVNVDSLKAELEELRKAKEAAEKEAKAHQATKKAQEAQGWKTELTRLEQSVSQRFDILAELFEGNTDTTDEYAESKQRKPSYKERVAEIQKTTQAEAQKAQQTEHQRRVQEILVETQKAKLQFDKSPELRDAYVTWLEGNHEEAVEKVKEVVSNMVNAKVETKPEVDIDKLVADKVAEGVKAKLIEMGVLDTETGQPKASTTKDDDFITKWNSGELPFTKDNIEKVRKINGG